MRLEKTDEEWILYLGGSTVRACDVSVEDDVSQWEFSYYCDMSTPSDDGSDVFPVAREAIEAGLASMEASLLKKLSQVRQAMVCLPAVEVLES